ncbi:MAG TPA: integrin alpha [Rhodanobacteraceae bacterium]|nr:integrin alpha [Rhodanobacteraceae bacterium]
MARLTGLLLVTASAAALAAPTLDSISLPGISGSTGARFNTGITSDALGQSVAIIGDINNDGTDDLMIGAPATENVPNSPGRAYVVFGRQGGFSSPLQLGSLNGSNGFVLLDTAYQDFMLGWRSAAAGDVNGDGVDDLLVSVPYAAVGGRTLAGKVFVVYGRKGVAGGAGSFGASLELSTMSSADGFEIDGAVHDDRIGFAAAGAGDFNGDGYDDIIIGPGAAGDTAHDDVYIVFGGPAITGPISIAGIPANGRGFKLVGPVDAEGNPPPGAAAIGSVVAGIGDVNDDGHDDVAIGAPNLPIDNSLYPQGKTWVVFGRVGCTTCQLDLATLGGGDGVQLDGSTAGAASGSALDGIGDINGDTIDDFIIGAPKEAAYAGGAYVIFGSGSLGSAKLGDMVTAGKAIHFTDNGYNTNAGAAVAGVGDVNGDGVPDFMVGIPGAEDSGESGPHGSAVVIFGRQGNSWSPTIPLTDSAALGGGMLLRGVASIDPAQRGDMSDVMSVAGGGDINHDGRDDMLVGAPYATLAPKENPDDPPTWIGAAYAVYGRNGAPDLIFADGFDGD